MPSTRSNRLFSGSVLLALSPVAISGQAWDTLPESPPSGVLQDLRRATLSAAPLSLSACVTNSITCNSSRSGRLETDDCVLEDKSYIDYYRFQGTAGETVTIDLSSTGLDAYLLLYDPASRFAESNDDTNTTNSRIVFRLNATGTWTIGATSARAYEVGSYSLSINCADLGSPNLAPYKPSAWSDKIVVSTARGGTSDTPNLTAGNTLYISWAVSNEGRAATDTGVRWYSELSIDGVARTRGFADNSLLPNYYFYWDYYSVPPLSPGAHTIRIRADSTEAVTESNELDNTYTKTINVAPTAGPPPPPPTGICTPGTGNLCLNAARFRVQVDWRVPSQGTSGTGRAVGMSGDTGNFWFFNILNTELVVKVLDGRTINGKFWFFYAALSDVEYTITVTDTVRGAVKTYFNPQGVLASVADTSAFTP